ncbi:hypothetical protein GGX14DRAFT_574881 [Mycena pura]|uniref:Uncharacterized protein n=1 Tax=Mycena pura TaxID=153505 RepID=A0AAD6UW96_9AGAR|nr:hypothetical protein GGX14DRAFT_574881 [Mycena pura]
MAPKLALKSTGKPSTAAGKKPVRRAVSESTPLRPRPFLEEDQSRASSSRTPGESGVGGESPSASVSSLSSSQSSMAHEARASQRAGSEQPGSATSGASASTLRAIVEDEAVQDAREVEGRDSPPHGIRITPLPKESAPLQSEESITAALAHRSSVGEMLEYEYPKVFQFAGRILNLYDEPLEVSVLRHHGGYEPRTSYDPLTVLGVPEEALQYHEQGQVDLLRDIVVRYSAPHLGLLWDNISEAVARVANWKMAEDWIVPVNSPLGRHFRLEARSFELMAHLVCALQQILGSLGTFLGDPPRSRFSVDPAFALVRHLERSFEADYVSCAFGSLQLRLTEADRRVRKTLQEIVMGLTGIEGDRLSSIASTTSEVRRAYGKVSPTQELR